jgi:hypothetical protein
MIECIRCQEEHSEKFIQYDFLGDPWCVDCLEEELEINLRGVE